MEHTPGALIAMSGGVDSSVAAYLMQQKGYRCMGITMRPYSEPGCRLAQFPTCCSPQDIEDAKQVAFQLDMPYEVMDFSRSFRERVIDKFVRVYESGGTPNPCIDCNRTMRFASLLEVAKKHDLDYVVTGHYARVAYDEARGRWLLKKAAYEDKDQSYMLCMLTQDQLAHIQFPLGGMDKPRVREIADELYFVNARKRDSVDICFIPDGDYGAFMERYTGKTYPAGDFLDQEGNVVGQHRGAVRYTLGQRKGLGLAMGTPVYVSGKDMEKNTVTVGPNESLFSSSLVAEDMNWVAIPELTASLRIKAKTRYRQKEQWATAIPLEGGRVRVDFDEPQRAVTPGQAVVLYDGDIVVGGGTIVEAFNP